MKIGLKVTMGTQNTPFDPSTSFYWSGEQYIGFFLNNICQHFIQLQFSVIEIADFHLYMSLQNKVLFSINF